MQDGLPGNDFSPGGTKSSADVVKLVDTLS